MTFVAPLLIDCVTPRRSVYLFQNLTTFLLEFATRILLSVRKTNFDFVKNMNVFIYTSVLINTGSKNGELSIAIGEEILKISWTDFIRSFECLMKLQDHQMSSNKIFTYRSKELLASIQSLLHSDSLCQLMIVPFFIIILFLY